MTSKVNKPRNFKISKLLRVKEVTTPRTEADILKCWRIKEKTDIQDSLLWALVNNGILLFVCVLYRHIALIKIKQISPLEARHCQIGQSKQTKYKPQNIAVYKKYT